MCTGCAPLAVVLSMFPSKLSNEERLTLDVVSPFFEALKSRERQSN